MEGIGDILPRVVRRMGIRRQLRLVRADQALHQVCGDYLRPHVRVMAVEGTTLVVACAHPAIAHQLQMDSVRLLDAVNLTVGEPRMRRVRFVTES